MYCKGLNEIDRLMVTNTSAHNSCSATLYPKVLRGSASAPVTLKYKIYKSYEPVVPPAPAVQNQNVAMLTLLFGS